ncbi:hypothetical protein ACFL5X_00265 [Candidatus Omnitrophota bacterium]
MSKKKYLILEVLVLVLGIFFIFKLQFANATIFAADGYLHIRMAEFIRDFGIHYDFHWTRFSVFIDRFSDKDFLFHILLIPFTYFDNIFYGAKLAAALFFSSLFIIIYVFLRKWSKRKFVFLFLLLFLFSYKFLLALSRPRPFSLVIILTILAIYFLIEKRRMLAFFTTLLYCLAHISGPYMIFYVLLIEFSRFLSEKEISYKNILTVCAAVLCGFLIHPYFPNNIFIFYLNAILVPFYAARTGVLELGAEFFPLHTRDFFFGYPFLTLGMLSVLFFSLIRRPKVRFVTKTLFLFSAFYYLFSFMSQRYLIHAWPVCLLFFACYFSDLFSESQEGFTSKNAPVWFISGLAALMLIFSIPQISALNTKTKSFEIINQHYETMAYFMRRHIPKGELIFHANWSDSQYFIGLNPDNDYFVTLDPVYMYHYDKVKYRLYRELSFGRVRDPYTALKEEFGTRYGYAGKNYFNGLINQVKADSRFSIVKEDRLGILFALD